VTTLNTYFKLTNVKTYRPRHYSHLLRFIIKGK